MLADPTQYNSAVAEALTALLRQPKGQLLHDHGIVQKVAREQLVQQLQSDPPDLEARYGNQVEPFFLERRAALEQVVFSLIRLQQLHAAEELYLRLSDDGADFGELARGFSLGQERLSGGLIGPMAVGQLHPRIAAALGRLEPGQVHPPVDVEPYQLVLRLEHREPASLSDALRQQLLNELLERELGRTVEAQVQLQLEHLQREDLPPNG
jgi:parvulin-like peptidyl-prolyl isomerase